MRTGKGRRPMSRALRIILATPRSIAERDVTVAGACSVADAGVCSGGARWTSHTPPVQHSVKGERGWAGGAGGEGRGRGEERGGERRGGERGGEEQGQANRSRPTPSLESMPTPSAESMPTPSAESMPTPSLESMPTPSLESMPTPLMESMPSSSKHRSPLERTVTAVTDAGAEGARGTSCRTRTHTRTRVLGAI